MKISKTSEDNILIGVTGDVMIGRLVEEALASTDPFYIWGDTLSLLQSTDMNLINLEAALTTSKNEVFKTFNFKARPERVEALKFASVDAVNLANNHCLDYSEEGLLETLEVLNREGIPYVGAGKNLEEARKPLVIDVKGIKIGILGFTDNEPSWLASKNSPGTNYVPINEKGLTIVTQEVAKMKDQVDLVILTIHWGPNMRERPPLHFQEFAKEAIDRGVDVFHGHSAHIFQGVEVYDKKVIFYDTGDFVDDYYVDPILRNDRSFFFMIEASKEGIIAIHLVPTLIGNCQVNLSRDIEKKETMQRMKMLSSEFGTNLTELPEGFFCKI